MVNVVFYLVNLVFAPVVSFVVPWFEAEWCYHCHLLGVRSDQAPAPHPLWQKRQSTCLFLHRWLFLWVTKSLHKAQKLQLWSPIPPALWSLRALGPLAVWPLLGTLLHHHPPSQLFHGNQALTLSAGLDSSRVASLVERSVRLPFFHLFLHAISSSFHQPVSHLHCISIIFPAQLLPSVNKPLTFLLLQSSTSQKSESIVTASPHISLWSLSYQFHYYRCRSSDSDPCYQWVSGDWAHSHVLGPIEDISMGSLAIYLYMWWHEGPSE